MPRYIDVDELLRKPPDIHDYYDESGEKDCAHGYTIATIKSATTLSPDEVRGVGETTGDDACPSCGCWIPTDDAHDAIFKNEVKFCYYCGMRLRMKGADA